MRLTQYFGQNDCTICWIQGVDKEWKLFARNSVAEIRLKVSPEHWNHCSGKTKPTYLPFRGISLSELAMNKLRHCGPDWLPSVFMLSQEKPCCTHAKWMHYWTQNHTSNHTCNASNNVTADYQLNVALWSLLHLEGHSIHFTSSWEIQEKTHPRYWLHSVAVSNRVSSCRIVVDHRDTKKAVKWQGLSILADPFQPLQGQSRYLEM